MLRCIAIDDEPNALNIVGLYIDKIPFLHLAELFRDALEALEYIQLNSIDLIFLDINMPDISGIEFVKSLSNPPMIIFTTAHSDYAVESYEYKAIDYLLKPILFNRFLKAANKAMEIFEAKNLRKPSIEMANHKKHNKAILVRGGSEAYRILTDEILYIEGCGNYIFVHCREKKIMPLMRMKDILKLLPVDSFCQIHKSYIIAIDKVDKIERHQVVINHTNIPIGNIYREVFFKMIG